MQIYNIIKQYFPPALLYTILGAFLGIISSFFVSRFFYKKAESLAAIQLKEAKQSAAIQLTAFNKIPTELKEILKDDSTQKLTIPELNTLINEKVYDNNSTDPLPYKFCPECGSSELERYGISNDDTNSYFIKCKKCGFSDSTE